MGAYEDIETFTGALGYETEAIGSPGYNPSYPDIPVSPYTFLVSEIESFTDIENLLSLPADTEDLNIAMLDGNTVSVYGFGAEFTVVYLIDCVGISTKYVYVFKYVDSGDYAIGLGGQTPAAEVRA